MRVHAFDQIGNAGGAKARSCLELQQQAPELDTVLVAVGGGGLIGGIAAWYESKTRVIAVEPEGAPTLADALKAGIPVDAPTGSVAADSLAPKRVGELMFPIAQAHIERVVLVTDHAIRTAQKMLWGSLRLWSSEPGGARRSRRFCRRSVISRRRASVSASSSAARIPPRSASGSVARGCHTHAKTRPSGAASTGFRPRAVRRLRSVTTRSGQLRV